MGYIGSTGDCQCNTQNNFVRNSNNECVCMTGYINYTGLCCDYANGFFRVGTTCGCFLGTTLVNGICCKSSTGMLNVNGSCQCNSTAGLMLFFDVCICDFFKGF